MKKVLLVNICKEKLHYFEFVKPVEDVLKREGVKYFKRHYTKIKKGDDGNIDKIIICGTSLSDNDFFEEINYFRWLQDEKKPVLGICGGMQIIGLVSELKRQVKDLDIKNDFGHILKKKTEIGFYFEKFKKKFLGLSGKQEVYHLHNYFVDFNKLNDEFEIFSGKEVPQAVRHKKRRIYGVLFHPEVRNQNLILEFVKNG